MADSLSKDLDGKVILNGIDPGIIDIPGKGQVDLRTCKFSDVEAYAKKGRFLSLKKGTDVTKTTTDKAQ